MTSRRKYFPTVQVKLLGLELIAVVDSCASDSFLQREYLLPNIPIHKCAPRKWEQSAEGTMVATEYVHLPIRIHGHIYENKFYLTIPEPRLPVILGYDFQERYNGMPNYKTQSMVFQKPVAMLSSPGMEERPHLYPLELDEA